MVVVVFGEGRGCCGLRGLGRGAFCAYTLTGIIYPSIHRQVNPSISDPPTDQPTNRPTNQRRSVEKESGGRTWEEAEEDGREEADDGGDPDDDLFLCLFLGLGLDWCVCLFFFFFFFPDRFVVVDCIATRTPHETLDSLGSDRFRSASMPALTRGRSWRKARSVSSTRRYSRRSSITAAQSLLGFVYMDQSMCQRLFDLHVQMLLLFGSLTQISKKTMPCGLGRNTLKNQRHHVPSPPCCSRSASRDEEEEEEEVAARPFRRFQASSARCRYFFLVVLAPSSCVCVCVVLVV